MFYALRYPQNLNSLILSNTTPASSAMRNASFARMSQKTSPEDSAAQAALVRTDGFRMREHGAMEEFFRLLFRGSFADKRFADSLTLTLDTSYAAKSRLTNYLYKDTSIASYDLHPALARIHCATLIVGGEQDLVSPEALESIHAKIGGSELLMLRECGHFPFVERAGDFFPPVESFLGRVTVRR